jgi:hypothetical protein
MSLAENLDNENCKMNGQKIAFHLFSPIKESQSEMRDYKI